MAQWSMHRPWRLRKVTQHQLDTEKVNPKQPPCQLFTCHFPYPPPPQAFSSFCPAWIPLLFSDLPVNCLLENSAYKCKVELIISYPGPFTTHSAAQYRNLGTPSLPSFPLTYNWLQNYFNSTMLHLPSRFTAMTSVQASFMSYLLYGNNLPAGPPPQTPLSLSSLVSSL